MIRYPFSLGKVTKRSAILLISVGFVAFQPLAFAENAKPAKPPAKAAAAATTSHALPKIIELGAEWCVPCRKFKPIFDRAKSKFGSKADFQQIDYDTDEGQKFAEEHNMKAVPTIWVVDAQGKTVYRHSGAIDEATFTAQIKKVVH
jgi:thioredoxin 1